MDIINIQGLTKTFGDKNALDNVDLTIKEGEVFGLLGPNGAGKTTLIRTLIGLVKPTSGKATVFGFDVEKDMMKIRQKTALLPRVPSI
ncbi:MAG: ATP-binding cassette domain-containing protein [Candidatus Heimdallarchaeota archaeon]|nr:ATP-binding cassette domain-containing protein [Candidatus Heimdallarchaeota archaeon]